jgi:hypothetical protein
VVAYISRLGQQSGQVLKESINQRHSCFLRKSASIFRFLKEEFLNLGVGGASVFRSVQLHDSIGKLLHFLI